MISLDKFSTVWYWFSSHKHTHTHQTAKQSLNCLTASNSSCCQSSLITVSILGLRFLRIPSSFWLPRWVHGKKKQKKHPNKWRHNTHIQVRPHKGPSWWFLVPCLLCLSLPLIFSRSIWYTLIYDICDLMWSALLDIDLPGHQVGSANSDIPKGVSPPGDWDRLPVEVQVDQGGHRKNIEKIWKTSKHMKKSKPISC